MKVILCAGIFPPESGGPATFVPQLAESLVERGHDVRVVTNGRPAETIDSQFPFEVIRVLPGNSSLYRYLRQVSTVVRSIRQFDADVVFTNAMDWQGVLAAKLTCRPVVIKIVGDLAWQRCRRNRGLTDDIETFEQTTYSKSIEALKLLRTKQSQWATEVIVPSNYLRDLVSDWGVDSESISVTYNSIESRDQILDYSERKQRIVTVGRLVNWKGVGDLIHSFDRIAAEYPSLEFHVVGNGPERERLERIADNVSATDRITFHGRVPHETVLDLLSESLLFALNSTYEGLPHVVLEAMSCGTPSVISDAGGNPEVVTNGENGYLCRQGSSSAFADRFEDLLTDEQTWREFQKNGLKRVETTFDYERMVDEYERTLVEKL